MGAGRGRPDHSSEGYRQDRDRPVSPVLRRLWRPGAQGLGYVSVLKLATGVVAKPLDTVLDGIVAYDRAEANTAYIGQINMETASSFCGITGQVWGYDLAVADEIKNGTQQPLFTVKQKDPQRTPLPVYDAKPLLDAGIALFGTEAKRRFPPAPGAHVICANKSITVSGGPPTLPDGSPDPHGVQNFAVWCYIALSIAKDRDNSGRSLHRGRRHLDRQRQPTGPQGLSRQASPGRRREHRALRAGPECGL